MSPRAEAERATCARVSRSVVEDPIGTAEHHDRYLLLELPMPWPHELWTSSRVPAGYRAVWASAIERGIGVRPVAIAPDPAYAHDDRVRLIHLRRPEPPFAEYERDEFAVPTEDLVSLTEALLGGGALAPFERYRLGSHGVRDLLVCTHGSLDACCGTYGFPFYRALRARFDGREDVRVWRASHFGGHRFAPTVVELPVAHYWAHLSEGDVALFDRRGAGPAPELRRRYRGWGGLGPAAVQVVEREVLFHLGWPSARMPKAVRSYDPRAGGDVDIRVEVASGEGRTHAYEATVRRTGALSVSLGCTEEHAEVDQYGIVRFAAGPAVSATVQHASM